MNFDGFLGNEQIKKTLEKPFHAYIICGPHGSGKHTLQKIMTASLICTADEKPCMKCPQCLKFLSGNHADVRIIESDSLKAEDLRASIADMAYKPNEAEHRVFVFEHADRLSVICQNLLLKCVEEPPEYTVFIFITESVGAILDTVRSRCITLSMQSLSEKEIMEHLDQSGYSRVSLERKAEAAAFSGGFIGAAEDFLSDAKTDVFLVCDNFATSLAKKKPSEMLKTVNFKKREELETFSEELYRYFTVHLRSLKNGNDLGLNESVRSLGEERLTAVCMHLQKINEKIQSNINISLFSTAVVCECYSAVWKFS